MHMNTQHVHVHTYVQWDVNTEDTLNWDMYKFDGSKDKFCHPNSDCVCWMIYMHREYSTPLPDILSYSIVLGDVCI